MEVSMGVRLYVSFVMAALAALPLAATVRADAVGDAAVVAMDVAINRASTLIFDYEIHNQEAGKTEGILAMKVQVKDTKRLHEFTAPADMKGTKVLILS